MLKFHGNWKQNSHFGPPFLLNVEEVFKSIRNIKFRFQPRNQLIPIELSKYDPQTIYVYLTIYGKLIDENYSSVLIENQDLSLDEVIALDSIQKHREVSKEVVQKLKKKRIVEGRYPNVFVSAHIADTIDDRAQYIKNKAFDADHYQQLILKFLDQYKSATRQDIDKLIMNKLPEILNSTQKKNKIGNLLGKMKRGRLIENLGSDKNPKWVRKKPSNE